MQMRATARFELEIESVMKQQHNIAASINRIDGNSTEGIARSPGMRYVQILQNHTLYNFPLGIFAVIR
ncbi:hypothetical protein NECAME_19606, partial [Necator americanus]